MKKVAQQHIDKAKGYADRGEKLYGSAADEIIAAQKADNGVTVEAIDAHLSVNRCPECGRGL